MTTEPVSVFHVEPRHYYAVAPVLIRQSRGRFYRIRRDAIPALCCGTDHIVVAERLAEILRTYAPADADYSQVQIIDPATEDVVATCVELRPLAELQPGDVLLTPERGVHIWHHSGCDLFVSAGLRAELERHPEFQLQFSEGFSRYAA
jgi:hypothetical protein